MFLFHVADWYKLEGGGDDAKLGALIVELEHDVPAFAKIRELSNAAKHWKLRPLKRRGLEPTSAGDMTIITTRAPPLSVSQPGRLVPDRKWWERGDWPSGVVVRLTSNREEPFGTIATIVFVMWRERLGIE